MLPDESGIGDRASTPTVISFAGRKFERSLLHRGARTTRRLLKCMGWGGNSMNTAGGIPGTPSYGLQPKEYSQTNNGQDGWPTVMNYLKTYDEGMMKDYSDDIDALLVLAGLFSAVVTGFVVESYTMLQEDNTQTSAQLLSRISTQLDSFHIQPPFVNSTVGSPSPVSLFEPTSAARWINALWFISLLFSLAAAVIGILVKQWIREYLKWNVATAHPRENVLTRRIRYEAWEVWQTTAIISSIPAMLELAVILFVCGLTVFLWTVDIIVAIAVTAFAAMFLIAVSTFTILPAFFKRCPYKSPTAWACVLAVTAVRRILESTWGLIFAVACFGASSWDLYRDNICAHLGVLLDSLRGEGRATLDWRHRDLVDGCTKTPPDAQKRVHTSSSLMDHVHVEMSEISATGPMVSPPSSILVKHNSAVKPDTTGTASKIGQDAVNIASEPLHLFNMLTWTAIISQGNPFLLNSLQRCAQALHKPIQPPHDNGPIEASGNLVLRGIKNVMIWSLFDGLFFPSVTSISMERKSDLVLAVRRWLLPRYELGSSGPTQSPRPMIIFPEPENSSDTARPAPHGGSDSRFSRYLFAVMLAQEIKDSVEEWLSLDVGNQTENRLFVRRIAELLSALQYTTYRDSFGRSQHLQILLDTYISIHENPAKEHFDSSFPGLRASLLAVIWRRNIILGQDRFLGYPSTSAAAPILALGNLVNTSVSTQSTSKRNHDRTGDKQYTAMWIDLSDRALVSTSAPSREECHIYHHIVANVIMTIDEKHDPRSESSGLEIPRHVRLPDMLRMMDTVMNTAHKLRWTNGGTYDDNLPWLAPLLAQECFAIKTLYAIGPRQVTQLLTTLQKSAQLITDGEMAVKSLREAVSGLPDPIILDRGQYLSPAMVVPPPPSTSPADFTPCLDPSCTNPACVQQQTEKKLERVRP